MSTTAIAVADRCSAGSQSSDHTSTVGRRSAYRSESTVRRDLRAITNDGIAFSVMVGIGETYLPAFALSLGKSELLCGLVATVPMLAGAVLQLVSPKAVAWLGSYRRWVVLCATVQAAVFIPLVVAASVGELPSWLLFSIAAIYWASGMATGPAWNTWVEHLVPRPVRSRFFACRSRFAQLGVLIGLLAGGLALHIGRSANSVHSAFALMFLVAGTARFISARFLASQTEDPLGRSTVVSRKSPPIAIPQRNASGSWAMRLISYLLALQVAVQIAGPFFACYMLEHMQMSYGDYVILLAAAFLARIAVLPALGGFAHRHGARKLLWIGALGIWPLSGLWLVSNSFGFLLLLQIVGGVVWAAHELAMLLLFFDSIPYTDRTRVLSLFNLANAAAMATGTVIGALVLGALGEQPETYLLLFAASSVARLIPVIMLAQLPQRMVARIPIALRIIAVRPSSGAIDRPIVASLKTGSCGKES